MNRTDSALGATFAGAKLAGQHLPSSGLSLLAPAKINLALHVTGRRPDGYHLIDTIAVFADFGDRVQITPAEKLTLSVSGPFAAHAPGDQRDLAWRAAEAFFAHTGLPARAAIHVEKNIPAGAGLGGGSADAAAVLRGLDGMFGAGLAAGEMAAIGLPLGADVPMCLVGRALRARGIGEEIEILEGWPALPLVLVWPGVTISTAAAFAGLKHRASDPLALAIRPASLTEVARCVSGSRNDLEVPARRLVAQIGTAIAGMRDAADCLLSRMSGSGSGCFGLFGDPAAAERAASTLRGEQPGWWVQEVSAR